MQIEAIPREKARSVLDQVTMADAVVIEDFDEGRIIRLVYHEVETKKAIVKTPLGIAKVDVPTERELSEDECREKFGKLGPDEVVKTRFNNGDEYEVVLIYEDV